MNAATSALESLRSRLTFSATLDPAAALKPLAEARRLLPHAGRALPSASSRAALAASIYDASGLAALGSGDGTAALNFFLDALRHGGTGGEDASELRARRLLNVGTALGRLARHSEARDFALAAVDTATCSQDDAEVALLPVAWYNAAAASEFLQEWAFARALYAHGASLVERGTELDAAFSLALREVDGALACAEHAERVSSLARARLTVDSLAADVAALASAVAPAIDADMSRRIVEPALPHRVLGTAGLTGGHRPPYPRALEQNMRVLGIGQPRVEKPRPDIVRQPRPLRQSLFQSTTTARRKEAAAAAATLPAASPLRGARASAEPVLRSPLAVSPRATIKMNAAGKLLALECRPEFLALVRSPRPSPRDDAGLRLSYRPSAESPAASASGGAPFEVAALHVQTDGLSPVSQREPAPFTQARAHRIMNVPVVDSSSDSIIERCQERVREAFAAVERSVTKRRGSDA